MARQPMILPPRKPALSNLRHMAALPLSLVMLAGCALTPEAETPQTVSAIENLDRYTSTALSAEEAIADQWWRTIGDTEIDALVHELRAESLTLKKSVCRSSKPASSPYRRAFFRYGTFWPMAAA